MILNNNIPYKSKEKIKYKMKKLALLSIILISTLTACNSGKSDGEMTTQDSLLLALSQQDSLLTLVNDINGCITEINTLENILAVSVDLEGNTSKREEIINKIIAIQRTLTNRRMKLDSLESKLSKANSANKTLRNTIEGLKSQIANQENAINSLKEDLSKANIIIEEMDVKIDSLSIAIEDVTEEKVLAQQMSQNLSDELATCFYVIGTKSELKEQKILESGFLKKTKVLERDFNKDYFTKADKRTLKEIVVGAKKAKVLTNQPTDSYLIEDRDEGKILVILDSSKFWSLSNYLVIQID